ncbi:AlpA family phage regulatory protein [Cronobacter sp. HA18006]|uniref:helix-turn-helix transcriptional regulator n=1 Tax=Cronobacter sp. HA18006 TaxID=2715229 RepID=UPI000CFC03D5|nr:AlpA family phage regulatory protein [Cronobacter sp. HA18006]ELY4627311.1 AlpA family phage regulatory protein [Cronobacter sakazakii]NHW97021.1 AlpA family phage regulatory protein [Cronobacter sp. HA18006]
MSINLMKIEQISSAIGFKKTQIYKWIKEESFPKPLKFGRCSRWVSSEIDAWIAEQIKTRRQND